MTINQIVCNIDGLFDNPDSDKITMYRLDLMIFDEDKEFLETVMPRILAAVGAEIDDKYTSKCSEVKE